MTRSTSWIGVGAFILAMMVTIDIDPSNRDIALRDTLLGGISLGGSPALAERRERRERGWGEPRLSIEDLARPFIDGDGDDDDDDNDDDTAADDDDDADDGDADDD